MPARTVLKATIQSISILDENGGFDAKLGKGLIPDEDLLRLYEHMTVCRHFDEVAFKLQRSGRMGTYPENRGQEAVSLGAAADAETATGHRRDTRSKCPRRLVSGCERRPPRG